MCSVHASYAQRDALHIWLINLSSLLYGNIIVGNEMEFQALQLNHTADAVKEPLVILERIVNVNLLTYMGSLLAIL